MQFKSLLFLVLMVLAYAVARKFTEEECKPFCEHFQTHVYKSEDECTKKCMTFDRSWFGFEEEEENAAIL
ncbi:unnamed protein product [Cylicocyclus nassatus]|uniref:Uncharacterized protein n=1 Tax=Cylicocyclus nassatus TaxID=53992 RepID=A0AA36GW21_CYLNA|nr:unnamed protein product [Cylicocyclus nassatus]